MENKRTLSFAQLVNLSFGFFGVQIAYALQSANISRIFATLGADPHQLSFFWILPPLMGMIVQPLIGKWSDRTWCRMGRRKPYLLGGAIVGCAAALLFAPEKGADLRERIKEMLKKKGIDFSDDEVERLVRQISAQIEN